MGEGSATDEPEAVPHNNPTPCEQQDMDVADEDEGMLHDTSKSPFAQFDYVCSSIRDRRDGRNIDAVSRVLNEKRIGASDNFPVQLERMQCVKSKWRKPRACQKGWKFVDENEESFTAQV